MIEYIVIGEEVMDDSIYNKLKNKIDNIEQKAHEKELKKIEKLKISTKKIYYKIWKLIIKNSKKAEFNIFISVKENNKGQKIVTMIEMDGILNMNIAYSHVNLSELFCMFEKDGLKFDYSGDSDNIKYYRMTISKYDLKDIIEKEKQKKLK